MHRILIIAMGLTLAWVANNGYAGHSIYHGYYDRGFYGGGYWRGSHWRGNPYRFHRHRHFHRSNNDAAWLLGGLVLSSVITAYQHPHHRTYLRSDTRTYGTRFSPAYPAAREIVYRTRTPVSRGVASFNGRHLFRDLTGNCFEIRENQQGDQLRQALPPEDCDW